jgi:hypothetical protein
MKPVIWGLPRSKAIGAFPFPHPLTIGTNPDSHGEYAQFKAARRLVAANVPQLSWCLPQHREQAPGLDDQDPLHMAIDSNSTKSRGA